MNAIRLIAGIVLLGSVGLMYLPDDGGGNRPDPRGDMVSDAFVRMNRCGETHKPSWQTGWNRAKSNQRHRRPNGLAWQIKQHENKPLRQS
jgi:hypothetical protein